MMPLTMVKIGEKRHIKQINCGNETRSFLASLGFVPSSPVTVINRIGGSMIVGVMDSRIAINREVAAGIMV